jgi:hypothetical protein
MAAMKSPRSASAHLSRISKRTVSSQDARQVLTAAFTATDYLDCLKNLAGCRIDPQAYIDGLDQVGSRLSMLASSPLIVVLY